MSDGRHNGCRPHPTGGHRGYEPSRETQRRVTLTRCYRSTLTRAPVARRRGLRLHREEGPRRARPLDLGCGSATDRADRLVRALTSGRGPDVMGNRPGSVVVIVILIVGSVVFGLLAIESTDNPTPTAIAPVTSPRATTSAAAFTPRSRASSRTATSRRIPTTMATANRTRTRPVTPGTTSSSTSRRAASPCR